MSLVEKIESFWNEMAPNSNYYVKSPYSYRLDSPRRYNSSFSVYKINPNTSDSLRRVSQPNCNKATRKLSCENGPVCIKHLVRDNSSGRSTTDDIWSNGEQTFERFDRRSSQPPIQMQCQEERRRKALTLKSEFNPSAQLDSVQMRLKPTEGRPQSLDCSQRKAWMKVYRDMEVSSAVQSSGEKYSSQQMKLDKSSRKSSLHRTELTPIRQPDSATVSSAVSDTSSNGIGNNSLKSTGSLFQRFSKTFSLRFGNTSSAGAGSKEDRTNSSSRKKMKARNIAAGSSPDIFSKIESDSNRVVDPSSGKFRNRLPLLKSNREDKCYSGDSGIQTADEHRNNVFPLFAPSRQFEHQSNGNSPTSPTSMKKLSLVEIPNHIWEHEPPRLPSKVAANPVVTSEKLNDDGFVSNDEAEDPDPDSSERSSHSSQPGYYHSLPLKYSRQRKAAFLEKKLSSARGNVIREMITTEQNYVKTLNDIVQGFLHPCRARKDLFSDKVTGNIFSNIEEILKLHVKLLDCLKSAIDNEDLARSNIGSTFTLWASKFGLYSEYCCHNPMSMATVRQLTLSPEYADFFEACRRLQLMDKLPLHGFLLRPIQRICQYHLQLNELLKQTDVSHEDYEAVQEAVEAMKSVAMNVNDTQRRFDALQEIVRLQASVFEGWEGPDLLETNTVLLHKGDLVKLTEGQKHKEVHVVLFNNEVLICKKDSNKKGTLSFNCRIDLRESVWVNIDSNYEDDYFGMVHNSFRIYRPNKCVWILFTASSPADKKRWTTALENTCIPYPADLKMVEMAKLTAIKLMFTESQLSSSLFTSSGTLPKLKKSRKGSAISKVDSDAMLIEVSKLRKSGYNQHYQYQSNGPSERSSKFYV